MKRKQYWVISLSKILVVFFVSMFAKSKLYLSNDSDIAAHEKETLSDVRQ